MREFDEAITHLKKATRRDPRNFAANYRLGLCQIRNNMREEGINSLKMCLSINPNDIDTMLKLSEVYQRDDKKIKEAEQMITKVLKQDPELAEAYIQLGRINEKQNKNAAALEAF